MKSIFCLKNLLFFRLCFVETITWIQVCECLNYKKRASGWIPRKLTANLKLLIRVGNLFSTRGTWIVHYGLQNQLIFLWNFFFTYLPEEEWLLLTYYLSTCSSWSFVLTRGCTLTWRSKILMRSISNVHAGRIWPARRRFPTPAST